MSPLRVGYVLKKFPRLSETFVLNEVLGQEALGTEIHVFARRPRDPEPLHPQYPLLRAQVEELQATSTLDPWVDLFDPSQARLLERFGRCVRELKGFAHPRIAGLFAEALVVLQRAQALELDHLHAHFATDSALVAMIVRELGGPAYSLTAHAKDIYRSSVNPALLSRLVAQSCFTVTVCDANVEHLGGILAPAARERVRRLYNGVDLEAFAPRAVERDPAHVLCVGRLVEKKGYLVMVEALELLARQGLLVRATFVGEGEERARIEQRIEHSGLGSRIRLAGALDQEAVRALMADATLLCMPCIVGDDGNRDALPTALLEAQAMGLPCISTPVTGIPEILDRGRAGVLVPENDPQATAAAIQELLGDRARQARLARAGRARAELCFDARKSAGTLRGWFEETAGVRQAQLLGQAS
jgi:glycosyltransferase involved in cell wall biosynthesis